MSYRLHLTATVALPPHLVREDSITSRLTKTALAAHVPFAIDEFVQHARETGVLDAGGSVTVVIQREPAQAQDGRQ